jgi:hypothetical protein
LPVKHRIYIFRSRGAGGPRQVGPVGCLLYLLGLIALLIVAGIILLPLLGAMLAVALGVAIVGLLAVAYFRVRAWLGRKFGRKSDSYQAEVIDDSDGDDDERRGGGSDRPRLTVEVHRRPHRE